ncbi:MAG TPA: hypothetical protein VME41_08760 [Stellaceae bacterium]|nr:hypothetical protein [Stellaceae bacterium]
MRPAAAALGAALLLSACTVKPPAFPVVAATPEFPLPAPLPQYPEPTTPAEVRAEIIRWFSAAGYRPYQSEALAEHARIESGYRPCARGAADLRYIYQWGGTRLRRLRQFAGAPGCPPLDRQLAFADSELRANPNYSCFWRATAEPAALAALRRGFGRGSC